MCVCACVCVCSNDVDDVGSFKCQPGLRTQALCDGAELPLNERVCCRVRPGALDRPATGAAVLCLFCLRVPPQPASTQTADTLVKNGFSLSFTVIKSRWSVPAEKNK